MLKNWIHINSNREKRYIRADNNPYKVNRAIARIQNN